MTMDACLEGDVCAAARRTRVDEMPAGLRRTCLLVRGERVAEEGAALSGGRLRRGGRHLCRRAIGQSHPCSAKPARSLSIEGANALAKLQLPSPF